MPYCFQLFKHGEETPTPLAKVDEELCKLLNKEVDPKYYVCGWFDKIGWWIAVERHNLGTPEIWEDFEEYKKDLEKQFPDSEGRDKVIEETKNIMDHLCENYSSRFWYESE